jgi:hypothetical protein
MNYLLSKLELYMEKNMEGNCQFGEMLLMWGKLFGGKMQEKEMR